MDNLEFFLETYKPFDEYLKKHKYDPETNTLIVDGKRMMAGKKLSNKERNRINKFLREHDYDPKTETIRTEVKDFTNAPERIKFDITNSIENASFNYNPFFPDLGRKIIISQNELAKKPYISNWTFKHEEGHFNENNVKVTRDKLQDWVDDIQDALKVDAVLPQFENKQQMKDALKYFQQKLNSFNSKMNEIEKIKDKADLFNDEQIKRGNMPKREGSYNTDHDVTSKENYADYYATKHNKYGDPSKSTRGTLSSYIKFPSAMSKHVRNDVIDKYLGEEVHRDKIKKHTLEILEKFEDPTVATRKLGLGKNMSDNEIRAMFKNHEDVVKIFNNRRNYVYNNNDYQTLTSVLDAARVDSNDYLDLKNKQKELKKSLVAEYKKKNPEETSKFDKITTKEDEYMKKFFEGVSPKELAKIFSKLNSRYSLKRELGAEHRQAFVNSIKESCLIMDNDEFFMETYKPFDEYLKKHKYDPKTNTIEIDGKREPIKTKMSNKEMNRLNKFLRENKYDPKTETILTDVDSGTSDKKKRVKFTMNSFSQDTKGAHYNSKEKEIHMPISSITGKPSGANTTLKHEEGHFNDWTKREETLDAKWDVDYLKLKLKHASSEVERKKIKDQIAIAERRHQKLQMQQDHINDIKKKANEFNDKQDLEGSVEKRRGKYDFDHDIVDFENYADYYATKHNKYGDPSKTVAGHLFNVYGYHKKNKNEQAKQSFDGKNPIMSIYKAFKGNFSHPIDAMKQAGIFDTLGIDPSYMDSIETEQSKLDEDIKKLKREKNQLRVDLEKEFPRYAEYADIKNKIKNAKSFEEMNKLELDPNWMDLQFELDDFIEEHPSLKNKEDEINNLRNKSKNLGEIFRKKYNITDEKLNAAKKKASDYLRHGYTGTMSRQKFVNSINESCLIMDNDEFFMETYKPFDEYLKKHKYDPKTNTIEIDGRCETIREMYLSNIITESEYVQLQERIQILAERSE